MNMKYFFAAIAAALLLVVAGAANAGEKIKFSGNEACHNVFADEVQIAEGHSVGIFHDQCLDFDDDPGAFGHLATGDCVGIYEARPDETYEVNGFCIYTYRDGSTDFEKFWETSEMETGRYEVLGGTGKMAGATGGGTYTCNELTDTLSHCPFSGVTELP